MSELTLEERLALVVARGQIERDEELSPIVATVCVLALDRVAREHDPERARSRPVTVSFRVDDRNPGHTFLSVWIGRSEGARGMSGHLVLRTDEFDELVEISRPDGVPEGHGLILAGPVRWLENDVADG